MKLNEMFSPLGSFNDADKEIDWVSDLKFFIDNDENLLSNYFFPAVKKHKEYIDHPKAYKIYIKPINKALDLYCKKFELEDRDQKFPSEVIESLARQMCDEQMTHIKNGDYENK